MEKERLLELAGVPQQLNEMEGPALRELEVAIKKAIATIAQFYENEGEDPDHAQLVATDAVYDHLYNIAMAPGRKTALD